MEEDNDNQCLVSILPASGAFPARVQSKRREKNKNVISKRKNKLDTNLFECHLENLWRSFSKDKTSTFTYFDSLWYSLYTKEESREKVLTWIKKKSIFSKKYIFVPIVLWRHWSLLIFCHFGESLKSENRMPCMLLLDSLQMTNPTRLEPGIRKFVLDLYKAEGRPETKESISKIPLLVPKVPQQKDDEACGNFVLYYIKLFVENAPENFSISDYPYFMKEDWFSIEGLDCFFNKLNS